jgi:hypothetical protein
VVVMQIEYIDHCLLLALNVTQFDAAILRGDQYVRLNPEHHHRDEILHRIVGQLLWKARIAPPQLCETYLYEAANVLLTRIAAKTQGRRSTSEG